MIVYFYYGIKNSTLELQAEEISECTMATTERPNNECSSNAAMANDDQSTISVQIPPTRPTYLETPNVPANQLAGNLFVSPSAFPKWDD